VKTARFGSTASSTESLDEVFLFFGSEDSISEEDYTTLRPDSSAHTIEIRKIVLTLIVPRL
jgi:hypothetical protein